MEELQQLSHGQRRWLCESSTGFSQVVRCNRVYDSNCSHCSVLQELFNNLDYHSRVDIVNIANKSEKPVENETHLEEMLRYLDRIFSWLFEPFLSCFAVQVSITLLQLAYVWSQQVILILDDLFAGHLSVERVERTNYKLGNLEVVWMRIHADKKIYVQLLWSLHDPCGMNTGVFLHFK